MGQEAPNLSDIVFNLRFTSKNFEREAKRAEKAIRKEKLKIKKAIEKGNLEGARIFAENAIRKKNESLNYYRLSARLDAVASRVDTAVKMKKVSKTMGSVVQGMDLTLKSMNVDKIAKIMDKFESQFENLDVRTKYMDDSLANSNASLTPEQDVNNLLSQVADEHNLEISSEMGGMMTGKIKGKKDQVSDEADDLSNRLAKLKNDSM